MDRRDGPISARTGEFLPGLHGALRDGLSSLGIQSPYAHQVEAWWHLVSGRDAVIATPTASGKTLCYNVPVVDALLKDPDATAIYIFPTKALARDQEVAIRRLCDQVGLDAAPSVYDGDTPQDQRRAIKQKSRVVITNPDMLHTAILPHHASFARLLGGLKYVVVDELHQYRGVFGSHVANVFRRLCRVSGFHGTSPVFAACSATIGNPEQLAKDLVGRAFELVDRSSAAGGEKRFLLYNPEVVDQLTGLRRSSLKVAARMTADLADRGFSTLVFCRTRRSVEMLLKDLKDRVQRRGNDPSRIRGYRGGYLPTLRREIESALRNKEVDAVVATNALELGIDVGELDAVVLAGYPGTIASTHQRAGRAGRRGDPSLAIMVANSGPLDQFLAREPRYLTSANPEVALVQPDNVEILLGHLKCAAFELPFHRTESFGPLPATDTLEALDYLVEEGSLSSSGDKYHYVAEDYPAAQLGLRDTGEPRVVVVNQDTGAPLGEVDSLAARLELHEQAIYQHEGSTYLVEHFDHEGGRAHVRQVDPVYFTTPVAHDTLDVLEEQKRGDLPAGLAILGDVRVTGNVTGFKKSRFGNHENLGFGPVELPPTVLETEAVWLALEGGPPRELEGRPSSEFVAGFEGLSHAFKQISVLRLMCDPRDLRTTVQLEAPSIPERGSMPVLYLYDAHRGGVGLSARAFREMTSILEDVTVLIGGCKCEGGCPVCVGPAPSVDDPRKLMASAIGRILIGRELG